jgi:3-dehydroquinate dehydratase/shikimate dehydrogenase
MGAATSGGTIVTSILEDGPEATERRFSDVPAASALIEIRADRLRAEETAGLVRRAPRPTIVAVRQRRDAGRFEGSDEERREILRSALAAGAAFVDVEWDGALAGLAAEAGPERVVISHHGGPCTAAALARVYDALTAGPPGRLKVVPRAGAPQEGEALRGLLARARAEGRTLAAFAMGPAGLSSRVFACSWGSWATYGAAAPGRATADGQPTAADLADVYRVLEIGRATRVFALAGDAVLESPSPAMHSGAYRDVGLDAIFLALQVGRFEDALAVCGPNSPWSVEALGVTIPYKESAAAVALAGDAFVSASRSANTLLFGEGPPRGYNTDAPAALALLGRAGDLAGLHAAIAGAGGTARAIAAALRAAGACVTLYNRSEARGRAAAEALGVRCAPFGDLVGARWDLFVNATPLGRRGEEILPARALTGRAVLDAAYARGATPLVDAARRAGLVVHDGLDLLAAQAALQFERMTGRSADRAAMEARARAWLRGAGAAGDSLDGA